MEYSKKKVEENIRNNDYQIKKKFGQNFIIDNNIINNIIDKSEIDEDTLVIEVGPGMGALTNKLIEKAGFVLAYEIDITLKPILDEIKSDKLNIIYEDFLKRDINNDLKTYKYKKLYLVANLPYYITTPILIKLIDEKINVDKIVVMVQKEVGDRFKAKEGSKDYSSLSILFNYNFEVSKLMDISRNVFIPKPNVDSIILLMKKRENKEKINDIDIFYKLIRDSFKFKRKTIRNNLKNYDLFKIEEILKKHNLDLNSRAEQINYKVFIEIANEISK